jgi:hypothetical protein
MNGVVVDLLPRLLRRPIKLRVPKQPAASIEVRAYQRAAIREDVCPVVLARALTAYGLTFSNDPDLGLVVHPMPGNQPPEAS